MNKKYLLAVAACTLMFTACGDDVTEVNEIHQDGMAVLEAGEKLSKQACDTTNVGEMLFVMDSSEAFICDGESWQTLKGADGKDGEDGEKGSKGDSGEDGNNGTSCTATKNTDGSFDLVCGGEKVGTITNGADSKNGADGRDGKDGTNGKDGVNGNDGTSCTATVNEDGNFDLVCGGKKVGTIKNGVDGKDGQDGTNGTNGTSCTATKNTDGSFDLVCGGEKVGTITNGADGKDGADGRDGKDGTNGKDGVNGNDGTSCTATVNEDGNFDLVCGGKKVGTIKNGADGKDGQDGTNGNDGTSCTATKNTDGNFDLVCGGEKVGTITNGKDGQDGTNGNDGTSCTAEPVTDDDGRKGVKVTCGGDEVGTIWDGTNGTNGTNCTAEPVTADDGRKGVKVTCGGDEVGTIWDGTNGTNGTSCTATENTDGSFDLVCGGEKVGTITNGKDGLNGNNGTDGTNCTAQSVTNAAGLKGLEVTCGETVVDTIWNGKNGEKGDPGTNGDNGNDGVGCSLEDDGEGAVSVTCGEGEGATTTTIFKAVCGTKPYDPLKSFCSEGMLYSCGDKPYDPAKSFCSEGEAYDLCDGKTYDPKTQYCLKVTRGGTDIYSVEDLLTDSRDEQNIQVYKTVKICNTDKSVCQTWMAENLNYSVNPNVQSWCGGGESETTNEGDCSVYGRLYTWAAAVGKSEDECGNGKTCNLPSGDIRGVCPEGWHLPSNVEWNALFTAVGGTGYAGQKLKADSDLWNEGTSNDDSFGFAVLPAGYRYEENGNFYYEGNDAYFWSSTEYSRYGANLWDFYYDYDDVSDGWDSKNSGLSVRCLRD